MCGICGLVGFGERRLVAQMAQQIAHRGPDDMGVYFQGESPSVGLGHTRLAVIDLSAAGHQPMSNEDGSIWITYNGEIYNYEVLKKEMEAAGHIFRSDTDTEVIVHLYEEKGEQCVEYLNGMFAFAIWDDRKKSLFAARDRLGIKPFYYAHLHGKFVFGSEIKTILASDLVTPEMDKQAFWDYLTFLYIPHPKTIYRDIYQLPPGHRLVYHAKEKTCEINAFWSPVGHDFGTTHFDTLSGYLRETVEDAVQRRLVSDVPLGAFLSGGIDSAILTGLMAKHSTEKINTFTVTFEGNGVDFFNERESAASVAKQLHANHHELSIDISNPEDMFDLVHYFDQPFGNPTFYLSYLIAKYTREHVTVALSGAGGDELFAGYPRYRALNIGRWAGNLPGVLRQGVQKTLNLWPDTFTAPQLRRFKLFFEGLDKDFVHQYQKWTYYLDESEKQKLVQNVEKLGHINASVDVLKGHFQAVPELDVFGQVQYADLRGYLSDNILEYTDRTSMGVALEVRVPFLDHRVVELSFATPFKHKLYKGQSKYILKHAFRDLIPKEHLKAPKKGFCPPLSVWIDQSLDRYFDIHMTKKYLSDQGLFHWDFIQNLRVQHRTRKRDNSMELFGLIMFDVWHRKYISGLDVSF